MTDAELKPPVHWVAKVGRRNLAYAAFVVILVPLAALLEAGGPGGPDSAAD